MSIVGEFIRQIILVIFYCAIIFAAVKLAISIRKKKNEKN